MSLVRSVAFLGNHDLYSINDGNENSEHTFNSNNNHDISYTSESYSADSYSAKYLLDSPSDASENPFPSIDYDEDKVRRKLQELEKVLLNDTSDESPFMETDALHDSPKETSSSSSISTFSFPNEITNLPPKSLLFECANSIHGGNLEEALRIINALRQRVSIVGEPSDRLAAYMVEALAARVGASGPGLYRALRCKEAPSNDRLSAMQVLFEVCPCFRFGFMAANGAIIEAARDETLVHIVDFDINQGSQYYSLLQALAKTPGAKRAHLRLTGVDDPETVQRPVGGLRLIGLRLEQLAADLGLSFEFRAVESRTALVQPQMLGRLPDEALILNFAFQLHHMPDESVSTVNLRDRLLRMVKGLKPKLVTVVEQEMNTNTAPFLARFAEAYSYYSAVFESLDATLGRESQDRMNVEKHCLARDIINVVACEGEERIERYEVAGKWRARMNMAGFRACPVSRDVKEEIRELIKMYSDRFTVKEEMGALHFGWEDKILTVSSAWR